MDVMFGEDEAFEAARKRNREILRGATDEELREIAYKSQGIFTLDGLKESRERFRQALDEQDE